MHRPSPETQVKDSTNTIWYWCTARQILWYKVVCQSFIKIWLSISSVEVKLFEQSAVSVNSTQEDHMTIFARWFVENVDHSIRTLTGKEHFMEWG